MELLTDPGTGPSVSIAMTTYNGARYLRQQLDSLARQTRLPAELVVSDDLSTDGTEDVVTEFASIAPFPVRFFRNEQRLGYRHNFTRAITYCTSDLIAFCDQDDFWYREKLECAAAAFADPTVVLWHHNARLVNNEWEVLGNVESDDRPRLSRRFSLSPWQGANGFTQIFRRSFTDFAAFWPRSIDTYEAGMVSAHDRWTFFLAGFLGSIVYEPRILADYRQHDANVYGSMHSEKGFRQRLRYWSRNREQVYQLLRLVASRNAEILSDMMTGKQVSPELRVNLVDASRRYAELSRLYGRRLDVYSGSLNSRMTALLSLVGSRAYSETGIWNFGHGALVKDFVMGGLLGSITRQRPHQTGRDIDIDMSCRPGRRSAVPA